MNTPNFLIIKPLAVVFFAVLALPAQAQAQICVDSDGDGWGWDGAGSCRLSAAPQQTTENQNTACIDTDGDGYGWNGTASCTVLAAPASSGGDPVTPETGLNCVDTDGDGWGWNGSSSCQAALSSASLTSSPVVAETTEAASASVANAAFDRERDLIALHFDHAPDRDDAHAAVAALMVRDKLGLNVQVVAGTYGVYSRDRYDAASEQVMYAVWGSAWHNAHSNFQNAVNAAVNRWTTTLAAGGSVWVAEGGPADFTAAVLRQINTQSSELDTRSRIHVIQHSTWNEDHSLAADLQYSRSHTNYVNIADGNDPNATADFRFESHNNGAFVARAQSSRYSGEWAAAFNYLAPSDKLDFSDTVELLHIVGLGINVISDVNDFGDYFF